MMDYGGAISLLRKPAELRLYPYPHCVIEDALPEDVYSILRDSFPLAHIVGERNHGEGKRVDLHVRHSHVLTGLWREFVDYHVSEAFWRDVLRVFGDVLRFCYPTLEQQYGPIKRWSIAPRGMADSIVQMECQPGVNTPQTSAGRVRGPHLDNPVELIGGLFYMGEAPGGALEVDRLIKPPQFHGKLELADECVEVLTRVPYRHNRLVMFLNTPISVHGVTPRPPTTAYRQLVNVALEMPQPLFRVGHGRY